MQKQSRSEKTVLLKDNHWDNAGANRIVGQECEMGPTNKKLVESSYGKQDDGQVAARCFLFRQIKKNKLQRRMISARVAAATNPSNLDLNQENGSEGI
jgi:hypothetical protein